MLPFSTWWERTARALIALSLAVLVLGPSLDVVLCRNDAPTVATAQSATEQLASDTAAGGPQHDVGHPDGLCSHGHCHHGGAYLLASLEAPGANATARSRHDAIPATPADSLTLSGPERPPRG